ncbi:MAG: hypothetical protein KAV87_54250 [Desulfobacteraceae bacterium]|nr:hypothetical protein [Desulfobacteraceae bacterium]
MSVRTQRNSLPLLCLNFKKTLLVEDWYEYFLDDFDDAILRPEWITHGLSADRTIVEASDVLTIAATNNVDARWWCTITNVAPKMYMPLGVIGPCMITTKLNSFDGDPGGDCNDDTMAGIFIGKDPEGLGVIGTDLAWLWGRHRDDGACGGLRVQSNCSSRDCNLGANILPRYLKIYIDAAGVMSFWHSTTDPDGGAWPGAWTQFTHGGNPYFISGYDIANSYVGLFGKNINVITNANFSAAFEYFLIEKYEAQNPIEVECLAPIDTRAPTTFYSGRIKQMSSLKRAVDDKTGLFQIADMSMTLANEDKHYSQKMASRFLKNQEAILYHAWTEEPDADKIEVIKLIVEDHSMKGIDFIVKFKDITQKYFTKQVPEHICTSDDFPDIHPEYEGWCMPEILGNASLPGSYEHPGAVHAVYIDTAGPPFRCLASAGLITIPADEVWIGDVQKTTPGDYTVVYAGGRTYIHFGAGQDPGDETVAFNAHGYSVPLWDSANGYIQNLGYIIQYYLRFLMDIPHTLVNSPSFVTLAGYYEDMGVDENCYLILQDRIDAMEVLRQLLFTGGAKGFMAMDGKFNVQRKNICNWEIDSNEHHIFEQIDLFESPDRKWNLTSAINTVNVEYGLIPWQDLSTGAKSEYKDNRYERPMEDRIRRDRPRRMRR